MNPVITFAPVGTRIYSNRFLHLLPKFTMPKDSPVQNDQLREEILRKIQEQGDVVRRLKNDKAPAEKVRTADK